MIWNSRRVPFYTCNIISLIRKFAHHIIHMNTLYSALYDSTFSTLMPYRFTYCSGFATLLLRLTKTPLFFAAIQKSVKNCFFHRIYVVVVQYRICLSFIHSPLAAFSVFPAIMRSNKHNFFETVSIAS